MSETDLYPKILTEFSTGDTRLFRVNAGGIAWQGTVIERTATRLVLLNPRPIKLGFAGLSDLIGWTGPLATFVAIEAKGPRTRITTEQRAFVDLVNRSGGRAGFARSVDEAGSILRGTT